MIRVGICDDDPLVRELLSETLAGEDLDVVARCRSGEEAVGTQVEVDVWLVDLRMPGMDGRETARALRSRRSETKVIILTAFGDDRLSESLDSGASAYLNKDATPEQLRHVIRSVMDGFMVVAPGVLQRSVRPVIDPSGIPGMALDDVDERIIDLLCAGRSYEEIAADVEMSVSGTKKRAARIMTALGVASRAQLVAKLYGLRA